MRISLQIGAAESHVVEAHYSVLGVFRLTIDGDVVEKRLMFTSAQYPRKTRHEIGTSERHSLQLSFFPATWWCSAEVDGVKSDVIPKGRWKDLGILALASFGVAALGLFLLRVL